MSELAATLDELRATLLAAGDESVSQWQPGPPPQDVQTLFLDANIPLHDDLVTWYSWHGESDVVNPTWIGGTSASWIPLGFAIEQYMSLRAMDAALAPDLGGPDKFWPEGLVPICWVASDGYLGIREPLDGTEPQAVVASFYADTGAIFLPSFRRLTDLVATWTLLHRSGGFRWDGTRWLQNPERIAEVLPPALR